MEEVYTKNNFRLCRVLKHYGHFHATWLDPFSPVLFLCRWGKDKTIKALRAREGRGRLDAQAVIIMSAISPRTTVAALHCIAPSYNQSWVAYLPPSLPRNSQQRTFKEPLIHLKSCAAPSHCGTALGRMDRGILEKGALVSS